jgi:beta-glucosidase
MGILRRALLQTMALGLAGAGRASGAAADGTRRIAFIDQALAGLRACLDEGIPVHGYLYWSLLDNFEWTAGYGQHFGLAAVDLQTFRRTPRPSAFHLGAIARANRL